MICSTIRVAEAMVFGPSLMLFVSFGWSPASAQEESRPGTGPDLAGLAGGGVLRSADLYLSSPPAVDAGSQPKETSSASALPLPAVSAALGPTPFPPMTMAWGAEADEDEARRTYLEVQAGPLWFINDFDDLDVGGDIEGIIGARILPFLSSEARSGYIWGEDSDSDLWAVPILGNLRLTIPLLLFKPYAGAGIGTFYLHTHESRPNVSATVHDWVFGWNAFAGLDLRLGPVILGVEIKYLGTAEADTARGQASLEGVSLLANLGFRF